MPRTMLTDIRWELLLQVMKSTGRIYDKTEHRMTFEGILYRMRTVFLGEIYPLSSESGVPFTDDLIFGQRKGF